MENSRSATDEKREKIQETHHQKIKYIHVNLQDIPKIYTRKTFLEDREVGLNQWKGISYS